MSTHYASGTTYMPTQSFKKRLGLEIQFGFLKYIGTV